MWNEVLSGGIGKYHVDYILRAEAVERQMTLYTELKASLHFHELYMFREFNFLFVKLYTYECMLTQCAYPLALQKHFCIFMFVETKYFDNFCVAFWDAGSCFADTGRDSNALNHPSYIASQSVPLHFPSDKGVFFVCFFKKKKYFFCTFSRVFFPGAYCKAH